MRWNEFKEKLKKQGEVQPSLNGSLLCLWAASKQASDLADCCLKQQQFEQAYVYYLRAANTLIIHAPKHADFPSADASTKSQYKKLGSQIIEQLEKLTAILQEKWDAPTPESEPEHDYAQNEQESISKLQEEATTSSTATPSSPAVYHTHDDSHNEFPSAPPAEDVLDAPPPYSSTYLQNDDSAYRPPNPSEEPSRPPPAFPITPSNASSIGDPFANLRLSMNGIRREHYGKTSSKQDSILNSINAIKRLRMPSDLPWVFLRHVQPNTSKNVETCGFLLGKLSPSDEFVVTELYIPPQAGTADTVNVGEEGDEATLNYAISNSLCILGWIHTHPSQACFLSSVDLHTQFIYQATQSSFVGIVMAPSYPKNNIGYFTVTEKGQSILRKCSKDGFHQHSENEGLYCAANHVILEDNRRTKMVDGR